MRTINEIIIHCSATQEGNEYSNAAITRDHLKRGFRTIGYHYVIGLNGEIRKGRNVKYSGAHCKGRNKNSIGICYIGGLDKKMNPKDTRTTMQKIKLKSLIQELKEEFPGINKVSGHYEYSNKECPCFDVEEYKL